MAKEICLKTITDIRGNLTVIEKEIPFEIKRIFFIYGVDDSERGKHRHKTTRQFLVSIQGSCEIHNKESKDADWEIFHLDTPSKALLLEPSDWHLMKNFSPDCILQVFASTVFNPDDYIYEPY